MGGIFVSKYTLTFPGHSFLNRRLGESKLILIQFLNTIILYLSIFQKSMYGNSKI